MTLWSALVLWWKYRRLNPESPQYEAFEIKSDCRYLCLVDSRFVPSDDAHALSRALPNGSSVFLVDCAGNATPKDVIQLFVQT